MLESSVDAALILDKEGAVLALSDAARTLLSLEPDCALSSLPDLLEHANILSQHDLAGVATAVSERGLWSSVRGLRAPDGTITYVRLSAQPVAEPGSTAFARLLIKPLDQDLRSDAHVAHRLRVEEAVGQVSRLLMATDDAAFEQVLKILGVNTDAEYAYLQLIPDDHELVAAGDGTPTRSEVSLWRRDGGEGMDDLPIGEAPDDDAGGAWMLDKDVLAVPVLADDGRFFGYLGLGYGDAYHAWRDEDQALLNVVGDMLAGFFDRVRAHEALLQSEERWRRLVESHPDPIFILYHHDVQYANPAAYRLLGAESPEEVKGRSVFDFVSAEDQHRVEKALSNLNGEGTRKPLRVEVTRLDGEWRIVEAFAVPILFRGQEAAQTVLRDITERLRTEGRYSTFVETITEGIWHVEFKKSLHTETDADRQASYIRENALLVDCNSVMAGILGVRSAEAILNKPLFEHFACGSLVESFVRGGYRVNNFELTIEGKGMRHFVCNAVGTVQRGLLVGIWGSCIDVTERVALERRMVATLEEQQQRIGRELHDGVGQLLTGVRMLSQIMAENTAGTEAGELAGKIAKFAEDASQQVRSIYYGLTPAQLTLEGLASALEELVINTDALPNITCTYEHDGRVEVTELEEKLHLYRIVQEAVNNALKHARASNILVSFRGEQENIIIRVTDNGIGFDPTKRNGKSLGVDSMHYRARAIHAHLDIDSTPGSGTSILCILRRSRQSVED